MGDNAFDTCKDLTSVNIGKSVKSIGKNAFSECSSLTSVTVDAGNPNYCSENNVIYTKDKSTLVYCMTTWKGDFVIPNTVTSIRGDAFHYCKGLTSLLIGNSVTSIGEYVFSHCNGLTSVTIGNSVANISGYAFAYCTNLKNLYLLGSSTISSSSFANTPIEVLFVSKGVPESSLKEVITKNIKKLYVEWRYPYTYQSSWGVNPGQAVLYVPKGTADNYWAEQGWRNFSDIIEYDVDEFKKKLENNGSTSIISLHDNDGSSGSIVAMQGGGIEVSGVLAGRTISVFTTDGKRIASVVSNGQPQRIGINERGVVIIKIGSETFKAYLR